MGCSAIGGTEHELTDKNDVPCGILGGHAYSIIDVFEIKAKIAFDDNNESEESDNEKVVEENTRLIRLRNPWGNLLILH